MRDTPTVLETHPPLSAVVKISAISPSSSKTRCRYMVPQPVWSLIRLDGASSSTGLGPNALNLNRLRLFFFFCRLAGRGCCNDLGHATAVTVHSKTLTPKPISQLISLPNIVFGCAVWKVDGLRYGIICTSGMQLAFECDLEG